MRIHATNEQIALTSRLRYRAVGDEGVLVHLDNGRVIVVNEVVCISKSWRHRKHASSSLNQSPAPLI